MDAQLARVFRPTGITGPLGAAAGGARLLGLDLAQTTHALALAANTTSGFNQWGHTGGSEMYFHPGFAARNGVTAVLLAQAGAFASPSALDGQAGLFAALGKRAAASGVRLFEGAPEILAGYHKPVPACNFAQTACLAAVQLAQGGLCPPDRIEAVTIRVPRAGVDYPGCDFVGPFAQALQAMDRTRTSTPSIRAPVDLVGPVICSVGRPMSARLRTTGGELRRAFRSCPLITP